MRTLIDEVEKDIFGEGGASDIANLSDEETRGWYADLETPTARTLARLLVMLKRANG